MEKETTGTVISVTKQWWLKVNRKPVRTHAMDGAAFPHIIKVKYTIGVKDYTCQKWIGAGNNNSGGTSGGGNSSDRNSGGFIRPVSGGTISKQSR